MTILLQRAKFKKRLMPILFPLMLAGCTNLFGSNFQDVLRNDANASSEFYMNKIEQTREVEDQQTYKLLAARVLVTENKTAQAEALLAELTKLTPEQQLDKSILDALIAAVKRDNDSASALLKTIPLAQLSQSQTSRYYEVQARIAENKTDIIEAVKARIQMDMALTDVQRKQDNIDKIWALLRSGNKTLINTTQPEGNVALAGWLDLTKAYNDNLSQPSQLAQALQNWKTTYPNHSAAYLFPTELKSLSNFTQTQVNKIALLLPLSGNASILGSTIKSGFDDSRGADKSVQVDVIDTMAMPVTDAIALAKQNGDGMIVGPLLKDNVDVILSNPTAVQGMNVLALNSTPNARAIDKMCYYGLAPEDEAEAAANRMWNDGVRQPIVAVPQSDLGQRTASAFNVRWQQLAASDADVRYYNQPDDAAYNLTADPAQNQAIYIVVTDSEQLMSIKGALDNSGVKAKIYTNSRNNSSNNAVEYRLAMEGVTFSDIPFFKDLDGEQYKKIEAATGGDYSLMRLYAMGADSWLLAHSFNELRQVPGFSLSGLTGKLTAGPNCNVERDLTWYSYQGGNIVPLN
ncbi:penicillin-binding protein activator [[Mannheimia] succiniciproducens]|uniref:Penicillin-binding protein activator LpoA n=1 Tax=Mannheimia succiniciproducens (strain KCTC 0769BP / MBEL55E) TaxID=221988 RepID=LPOA_MANSM|nr:penicillin-binding protein activator [[Mannheimia] succiniciproducens]Q65T15.1 RecName: Full=Penicillin-binding protein activator LpoA; Short=PBP activator LpoA; Flags: Precursor [[Mannheimia] succiniciproducens MBEL55E]AAU37895.1 LppC protein [[Mannheimia] succiniciproducens MBEL55E]